MVITERKQKGKSGAPAGIFRVHGNHEHLLNPGLSPALPQVRESQEIRSKVSTTLDCDF